MNQAKQLFPKGTLVKLKTGEGGLNIKQRNPNRIGTVTGHQRDLYSESVCVHWEGTGHKSHKVYHFKFLEKVETEIPS
jgi:hypothetical protein